MTNDERAAWDDAATANEVTTSEWVRMICNEAAIDPKILADRLERLKRARRQLNLAIYKFPETDDLAEIRSSVAAVLSTISDLVASEEI